MPRARTAKTVAASRRNIRRAQLSRYRTRQPRSIGRIRPNKIRSAGTISRVGW